MRPAITFLNIQLSNSRAETEGTNLLKNIFADEKRFPYPKSLYAVRDCLKYYLDDKLPSLTVEKQKNGCKASKINACSRFLFRNDMCYCAIFFTLW